MLRLSRGFFVALFLLVAGVTVGPALAQETSRDAKDPGSEERLDRDPVFSPITLEQRPLLALDDDPAYRSARRLRLGGMLTVFIGIPAGVITGAVGFFYQALCDLPIGFIPDNGPDNHYQSNPDCRVRGVALLVVGTVTWVSALAVGTALWSIGSGRMQEIAHRRRTALIPRIIGDVGPRGATLTARWTF
jgi:hypothetical protein